jgi:alkanesulfonate monooxygenase SsuD/methylene tetrahydromethanopterin reductase-like flavin-dependent oxidoreductase (luciferase family)
MTSTENGDGDQLEFGIFDWIDSSAGRDIDVMYDAHLDLLKAADRGREIATYHLAEHHGTPLGMAPSPALFIAAAARETKRIRLAPTTFVLPLYDPLRLVEEIAMLDHLSHGRLDVGVGRGSVPMESAMYGFDVPGMSARYNELAPIVLDALSTGILRLSQTSLDRPDVKLHVTLRQKPHPPVWYPTGNAATIPYLGDHGYNTLFGFAWFAPTPDQTGTVSDTYFEHYRTAMDNGGAQFALPGRRPRFGTMRHIFVAESDDTAKDIAQQALLAFNDSFTYLFRRSNSDMVPTTLDFDTLVEGTKVIVGSAESVADRLTDLIVRGRLNYFAGVLSWGSLTPEQSMSSFERFQSEVIPCVRTAVLERQAARASTEGRIPAHVEMAEADAHYARGAGS